MDHFLSSNCAHWNEVVSCHAVSLSYDVKGFKNGRNTLRTIEREEVGDVAGKSLLHLQCHFGMDSMSWARLGARVTGMDFSQEAINLAKSLARELDIDSRFVCSNIYDLPNTLEDQFDIVFTSYGVLTWLPDMTGWAKIVAHYLKPGGEFHIVEIHPYSSMFDYDSNSSQLQWEYLYFIDDEPLEFEGTDTYAAANAAEYNTVTYEWSHSLGEIVTSLIDAGLKIEYLHEFPFSCYRAFPCMTRSEDGWWRLPPKYLDMPLLFSIKAEK